jgi:hypothetical protein
MLMSILPIVLLLNAPAERPPENPFERRPVCAGMFLASEWQLSTKQRACDLLHNRIFSSSAMAGAVWSASTLPIWQGAVGRPRTTDSFPKRLAVNIAQNAFKSTGAYLGGMIQQEDPRQFPPFLVLKRETPRRGFAKRFWHAMTVNAMAYKCVNACTKPTDVQQRFAFSRVIGSLASGFSRELWAADRSAARGLRGAATAYGATFANSLFVEFKPELSALAGRVVSIF